MSLFALPIANLVYAYWTSCIRTRRDTVCLNDDSAVYYIYVVGSLIAVIAMSWLGFMAIRAMLEAKANKKAATPQLKDDGHDH